MRKCSQLKRKRHDLLPALRAKPPAQGAHHQDRNGEGAILSITRCNSSRQSLGCEFPDTNIASEPAFCIRDDPYIFLVSSGRTKSRPAERRCADIAPTPDRITPAAISVAV